MKQLQLTRYEDFIRQNTLYHCDTCGKTKVEHEITPQKISGLNIICKECHRNNKINTILNKNIDETKTS